MRLGTISLLCSLLLVCACAAPLRVAEAKAGLWQDPAFDCDPTLLHVNKSSLVALDNDLLRTLRADPVVAQGDQAARTTKLLELIFGADMKAFAYAGGHSMPAAETLVACTSF